MKKIIFINNLAAAEKIISEQKGVIEFVVFEEDKELLDIKNHLSSSSKCNEIDKRESFSYMGDGFARAYSKAVSSLEDKDNRGQKWALNCLSKSPIATTLFNNVFYSTVIVNIFEKRSFDCLLVLTKEIKLYEQVRRFDLDGTKIVNNMISKFDIKECLKRILPFSVIYISLKTIYGKLLCKLYLKPKIEVEKEYFVVMSLLNHQSFNNGEYRDVYFGDFVKYLESNKADFINLMEICGPFYKNIVKAKKYGERFNVVPKEYFISLFAIFKCLCVSLKRYFLGITLDDDFKVFDLDFNYLLKAYIRNELVSTRFFCNLSMFYAVNCMAKQVNVSKYYYPFENRAFEKMAIVALRTCSSDTFIVGYQHAALSLKHVNFYIEDQDYKSMPLPNKILTTGGVSNRVLKEIFNIKEELLIEGCALRRKVAEYGTRKYSDGMKNILVVLSTDVKEYCEVLRFLNKAMKHIKGCKIFVRPHPVVPLKQALEVLPELDFEFEQQDSRNVPLNNALLSADVLLYASSTIAIEALLSGLPVVHISDLDFLDTDPLYFFEEFKWNVSMAYELKKILETISSIDEKDFMDRQSKAQEYAELYMHKVDGPSLERFLNVN